MVLAAAGSAGEPEIYPALLCSGGNCTLSGRHKFMRVSGQTLGELVVENATIGELKLNQITADRVTVVNSTISSLIMSDIYSGEQLSLVDSAIGNIEVRNMTAEETWFDSLSVTSGYFVDLKLDRVSMKNCSLHSVTLEYSELRNVSEFVMQNDTIGVLNLTQIIADRMTVVNSTINSLIMSDIYSGEQLSLVDSAIGSIEVRNMTAQETQFVGLSLTSGYFVDLKLDRVSMRNCSLHNVTLEYSELRNVSELVLQNDTIGVLKFIQSTADRVTVISSTINSLIMSDIYSGEQLSLVDSAIGSIDVRNMTAQETRFVGLSVTSGYFVDLKLDRVSMRSCSLRNVTLEYSELRNVSELAMENDTIGVLKLTQITADRVTVANSTVDRLVIWDMHTLGDLVVENATIGELKLTGITADRVTVVNSSVDSLIIWDMHAIGQLSLADTHIISNIEVNNFATKETRFYGLSVASGRFSDVKLDRVTMRNCSLYDVTFFNSELRNMSMHYLTMENVFLSHVTFSNVYASSVVVSNLTENMTVEENSTWKNFAMINVNSLNTLKRNVAYINWHDWSYRWCPYSWKLVGRRYMNCGLDYDPHSYCLCNTDNVTDYKVTNGTFVDVSYTNMVIIRYTAIDTSFVNCSYSNAAMPGVTLLNVSAVNHTHVNVTSVDVTNVNSTWINVRSINSPVYWFLGKNIAYINLSSRNANVVNGTLLEVNYTDVKSVNDSWLSVFINQLWETDVTKVNFTSAKVASFNVTRNNVLFINSTFFMSTDWNVTHVNVSYSNVTSIRCMAVNVTEINETVVNGTYIDYSPLNVTTITSRKKNISYLWASGIFEFYKTSEYEYEYEYYNVYYKPWQYGYYEFFLPYADCFYQLYGDYENVPFLPNDRRCDSWCYYLPWTWPSYNTPMWRTWWHADVWKQSQEKLSGVSPSIWSCCSVSWFQPTDGLFYVWGQTSLSGYHNTYTYWPSEWGLKPREQNFHNLVFINSTLVDAIYNNTIFTNLSLVNTSCINSTFSKMTAFNSSLVNVTFYNVSFIDFNMIEYTAINVTEIMTLKVDGTWHSCTFVSSTFVTSTNLNCTFDHINYFNVTCLGCTAVGVKETDLLDINGTWIDYTAVDVTTTRALRRNVTFSNTSKWHGFITALPPTFYLSKGFNQTIESPGRKFYSQFHEHTGCLAVNVTDVIGTIVNGSSYRWWERDGWWRRQQLWLQDWWIEYCRRVRDPGRSELWPCGGCKNVYTISASSLIDSTYISVVMQDISAYDFNISESTFYHVRWSGGRSSHVAVRQSIGVSIQLENHRSARASFTDCQFYISSMSNCVHNAPRALDTNSYWSTSYNNYYQYNGDYYDDRYYYPMPKTIYDHLPTKTYRLLNEGGWCEVVRWHRRDGHCQSACDTSDDCFSQ